MKKKKINIKNTLHKYFNLMILYKYKKVIYSFK